MDLRADGVDVNMEKVSCNTLNPLGICQHFSNEHSYTVGYIFQYFRKCEYMILNLQKHVPARLPIGGIGLV